MGLSISHLVGLQGPHVGSWVLSFWQAIQVSYPNSTRLFVNFSPSVLCGCRNFQGYIFSKAIATGVSKRRVQGDLVRTDGLASLTVASPTRPRPNFRFRFRAIIKKQKIETLFLLKKTYGGVIYIAYMIHRLQTAAALWLLHHHKPLCEATQG